MWRRFVVGLALVGVACAPALAHETDQFTTPIHREFADLGDYYNRWAYGLIETGVDRANADIRDCLLRGPKPGELARLHDPAYLVSRVHAALPWSVIQIESMDRTLLSDRMWRQYPGQIVAFMESNHNIYEHAFSLYDIRIFSRWFYSPTVKVFGTYMGTDKFGHFTDVGISYYWTWHQSIVEGAGEEQAVARAVRLGTHGVMSEAGLLGTVANGDYSNGDLSANFAGFLFYRNLGEPTRIKGVMRPPMVKLEGDYWRIADHVRRDSGFFSLFISDHLDEALNPGYFDESMRPALREAVRQRAPDILWRYRRANGLPRTREDFEDKLRELSTYDGVDYGHRGVGDELVSIANTCFAPNAPLLRPRDVERASVEQSTRDAACRTQCEAMRISPLHRAAASGDIEEIRWLLRDGAGINAQDDFGRTPLHEAAARGDEEAMALLIDRGARVNAADGDGITPLHLACRNGHELAARALLKAGADSNATSNAGQTPLHEAAMIGDAGIIRLLLEHGARLQSRDRHDRTPAQIADARDHHAAARLLTPISEFQ